MSLLSRLRQRPRVFNWLHCLGVVQAYSQTHPEERDCLCRHVARAQVAVEIGTFMGLTAGHLAHALPQSGILYCVDPYPYRGDSTMAVAHRHLKRLGVWDRVRFIRAESHAAAAQLPTQVDFFFVDGDHTYDGLKADWQIVKRLLRPGGIAAFHDTACPPGAKEYTVQAVKFFDEVIAGDPDFERVETVMTLNVIRRRSH